jgi:hypothetical protein
VRTPPDIIRPMETTTDSIEELVSALERLGPPRLPARADATRRVVTRIRLGRLGEVALRNRIETRLQAGVAR